MVVGKLVRISRALTELYTGPDAVGVVVSCESHPFIDGMECIEILVNGTIHRTYRSAWRRSPWEEVDTEPE